MPMSATHQADDLNGRLFTATDLANRLSMPLYFCTVCRTIDLCGGIADVSNPCNRKAPHLDFTGITAASAVPDVCRHLGTGARFGPLYALRLQFLHRLRTRRGLRPVGMR
jgi:hypothetical protein